MFVFQVIDVGKKTVYLQPFGSRPFSNDSLTCRHDADARVSENEKKIGALCLQRGGVGGRRFSHFPSEVKAAQFPSLIITELPLSWDPCLHELQSPGPTPPPPHHKICHHQLDSLSQLLPGKATATPPSYQPAGPDVHYEPTSSLQYSVH